MTAPPPSAPAIIEKAVCYITRERRILVFEHPGVPAAGIQVPAGTIDPGEDPARAALREAAEETGLRGAPPDAVPRFGLPHAFMLNGHDLSVHLSLRRKLGVVDHDLRPYGRNETHRRHIFHLEVSGDLPESWTAREEHPSDGSPGPIEFRVFWADLCAGLPPLSGELDALLHQVIADCCRP